MVSGARFQTRKYLGKYLRTRPQSKDCFLFRTNVKNKSPDNNSGLFDFFPKKGRQIKEFLIFFSSWCVVFLVCFQPHEAFFPLVPLLRATKVLQYLTKCPIAAFKLLNRFRNFLYTESMPSKLSKKGRAMGIVYTATTIDMLYIFINALLMVSCVRINRNVPIIWLLCPCSAPTVCPVISPAVSMFMIGGRLYHLGPDDLEFPDAKRYCNNLNLELASVRTPDEYNNVKTHMGKLIISALLETYSLKIQ